MPLIQESHDSLPFIDPDFSPETRFQVSTLINVELPADSSTTPHPLLPESPVLKFSPLISAELERVAAKEPLAAIDTTRYEALEAPPPTSPTSEMKDPQVLEAWREILRRAYTSSSYLTTRIQNLALLESFGKNAWLMGNAQLEDILRVLEKELVETKERVQGVNQERYLAQEGIRGELDGLEANWRGAVGRLVEVEVACESIRRQVLERRRQGAA